METSRKTTDVLLELLKQKKSFDEYLQEGPEFVDMGLPQYLEEVMKIKGLKKADVIRKSQLDRIYAYQIFSGTRKPNRDKLLALGFGMELSIEEMQKMLKISEYPILYVKNKRDSIILFGLKKKASLSAVNELLYEMHENIIE